MWQLIAIIVAIIIFLFEYFAQALPTIIGSNEEEDERLNTLQDYIKYNQLRHDHYPSIKEIEAISSKVKVTIDDIKNELEFRANLKLVRYNYHFGQRKLFLSELQFLTIAAQPDTLDYVVYAGAAPGNHDNLLLDYFPTIKFILIDPNKFNIYGAKRIFNLPKIAKGTWDHIQSNPNYDFYIYNDIMTCSLADEFAGKNVLFICDIRTTMFGSRPTELDVLWNLSQQYNWMCRMRPRASYVKFRYPWKLAIPEIPQYMHDDFAESLSGTYGPAIDFLENFRNNILQYPAGTIYIQAFAPVCSTETRLFIPDIANVKNWGTYNSYENKFYFYNRVIRSFVFHENSNSCREIGFDHCADCALENHIWQEYARKFNPHLNIIDNVRHVMRYLNRNDFIMGCGGHGFIFDPIKLKTPEDWKRTQHERKKSLLRQQMLENKKYVDRDWNERTNYLKKEEAASRVV